jgi:dTMP kinase
MAVNKDPEIIAEATKKKKVITRKEKLFFGEGLPYIDAKDLIGKLVVIEGTDGVGRSTHINELHNWLELEGYAVMTTGFTRSPLLGEAIDRAKEGHGLSVNTFTLMYAADFADRLENQIIPALKAGFIVLADRYMYTAFARAIVRGAEKTWVHGVFGFGLLPDIVIYLDAPIDTLVRRVLTYDPYYQKMEEEGITKEILDYWESGMDMKLGRDYYDSFINYQKRMLSEFRKMSEEFGFAVIDTDALSIEEVNKRLKKTIKGIL